MYLLCISTYYQPIRMRQGCEVRVPRDMSDGMLCLTSFQGFLSASARLAARLAADLPRALGQTHAAQDSNCSAGWSALCDPNPSPCPSPSPDPSPNPNPNQVYAVRGWRTHLDHALG